MASLTPHFSLSPTFPRVHVPLPSLRCNHPETITMDHLSFRLLTDHRHCSLSSQSLTGQRHCNQQIKRVFRPTARGLFSPPQFPLQLQVLVILHALLSPSFPSYYGLRTSSFSHGGVSRHRTHSDPSRAPSGPAPEAPGPSQPALPECQESQPRI